MIDFIDYGGIDFTFSHQSYNFSQIYGEWRGIWSAITRGL